jgi:cell division protein FtsB
VLSVGFARETAEAREAVRYKHAGEDIGCTPAQKLALDELHKRKIDLADEVLVLNVGGYVGESTRSEIAYAKRTGKPVRWLETLAEASQL